MILQKIVIDVGPCAMPQNSELRTQNLELKKNLDNRGLGAYKPELADGAKTPTATMKTEEEKETQKQS